MFSPAVFSVALALSSSVSALSLPHLGNSHTRRSHHALQVRANEARKEPPPGWAYGYLEDYNTYHIRYLALDCQDQHNTTFFDTCCHPLLATESLSSRPAECTPSTSASSSASSVWSTYSVEPTDDDCTDEPESTSWSAVLSTSAFVPTSTESSSFIPTSTESSIAIPTSTDSWSAVPSSSESSSFIPSSTESSSFVPSSTESANTFIATPTVSLSTDEWWTSSSSWTPEPTTSSWSSSSTWSSSSAAATSTSSSSSSDSGFTTGGIATFFYQNGVAGACGTVHPDTALIAALQTDTYANGANCGRQVEIKRVSTGATVTVTVADECPTCDNAQSIDLSVGAFTALATETEGEFDLAWKFI